MLYFAARGEKIWGRLHFRNKIVCESRSKLGKNKRKNVQNILYCKRIIHAERQW